MSKVDEQCGLTMADIHHGCPACDRAPIEDMHNCNYCDWRRPALDVETIEFEQHRDERKCAHCGDRIDGHWCTDCSAEYGLMDDPPMGWWP